MTTKTNPNERTLRKITIFSPIAGLPLAIAGGVVTNNVATGCSAIPMFFSFVSSLLYLYQGVKKDSGKDKQPSVGLWAILDLALGLAHLGVLLPVWIIVSQGSWGYYSSWYPTGNTMLVTYATIVPMINMCIHFYLVLWFVARLITITPHVAECPHCHANLSSGAKKPGMKSREGYSLLRAEEYNDLEGEDDAEASTGVVRPSVDV